MAADGSEKILRSEIVDEVVVIILMSKLLQLLGEVSFEPREILTIVISSFLNE
jgi:hypothetical protein